ncbi:acyl-CoA dehydrogenase family protein [Streptomyces sp. NPDC010273]|uniref:acyl-CoA dehydrogenase family protein n=1 Tax=Streptomyces sp. NPDC010273 TaxID=3364829 RepID=UPI0036F092BC
MSTVTPADWQTGPAPRSAQDWIARAAEVAALLDTDAAARDRAGATPHAEVRLLKDSGLVTLLGPTEHGGGGQDWPTAYRVVREVAKADGSIGQLLGYHYLWNWAARLVGTREQWEHVEAEAARNQWFFGGAVNPRDKDVTVTEDGDDRDDLVFTGRKSFSTGSKVSDVTVLEGVLERTEQHVFAIVPSDSEGLTFLDDWDNIGQRLTESGGVILDGVRTPWSSAAGYVDKEFTPRTYNTLNVRTIQLVFVNVYLGIAAGALETAATYTRTKARSVAEGQKLHDDPDAVTAKTRGDFEVRVAAVKARATDVALEIGNRIFEVTGARSTATTEGLDRFWRNVRTRPPATRPPPLNEVLRAAPSVLHDPVAYQRREVGRWVLEGELPEPTWYS